MGLTAKTLRIAARHTPLVNYSELNRFLQEQVRRLVRLPERGLRLGEGERRGQSRERCFLPRILKHARL